MNNRRAVPVLLAALVVAVLTLPAGADSGTVTAHVTVGTSPGALDVELSVRPTRAGQATRATAVISNHGDQPINDMTVTLHVSEANLQVRGATVTVDTLRPRKHTRINWELCSTQPGTYLIVARAQAFYATTPIEAESPAVEFAVEPAPGRAPVNCPSW